MAVEVEEPKVTYEYTVEIPEKKPEEEEHEILKKLKREIPEIAHKVPTIAKRLERLALGIGEGILGTEEAVAKMKLAPLETKEKLGVELTPTEKLRKERLVGFISRVEALKGVVEEQKKKLEEVV